MCRTAGGLKPRTVCASACVPAGGDTELGGGAQRQRGELVQLREGRAGLNPAAALARTHTTAATVGSFSHAHNEAKTPGVRAGTTGARFSHSRLVFHPGAGMLSQSPSWSSEWLAAPREPLEPHNQAKS